MVLQNTAKLMGPSVPGAIAAAPGLIGKIRGSLGVAPATTTEEGEAIVFDMLNGSKIKVDGASGISVNEPQRVPSLEGNLQAG